MVITLSNRPFGEFGIVGHVGCGHVHTNNQFVQDDSGGLAVVLHLLRKATGASLTIRRITPQTGIHGGFEVETSEGGTSVCFARRGVTPQEACLAKSLEGDSAILTQALVFKAFGRMYGQGCHEVAVTLQTAIANAALNGMAKLLGARCIQSSEKISGNCGKILGTVIEINDVPISIMGVCNATTGGIGPNEDAEGNVFICGKKDVMIPLHLDRLPTFLVEGKIYSRKLSTNINTNHFLLRATQSDNPFVCSALRQAASALHFPVIIQDDEPKRLCGILKNSAEHLGESICALGTALRHAVSSRERVQILADLAVLISQDGGGISFMSDSIHQFVSGPGAMPGTSTTISMVVPEASHESDVVPILDETDISRYVRLISESLPFLVANRDQAIRHLNNHRISEIQTEGISNCVPESVMVNNATR